MRTEMIVTDTLPPELHEAKSVAERLLAMAAITTAEQADWVNEVGRGSASAIKTLSALHKEPCEKAHAAWKAAVALRDKLLGPFEEAKKRAAALLGAWNATLEAERRVRQAVADAAAKTLGDDLALAEAEALEKAGEHTMAAAVMDAPPLQIAVVVPLAAPKPAGFSGRMYYWAEVTDLMALVKAVAEGKVPLRAVIANQSWLDDLAGTDKTLFTMPGCVLKSRQGGSFR